MSFNLPQKTKRRKKVEIFEPPRENTVTSASTTEEICDKDDADDDVQMVTDDSLKKSKTIKYQCFQCSFVTHINAKFVSHLKIHLKKYRCRKCNYTMTTKLQLENHSKYCKKITCKVCDIVFKSPQIYESHLQAVHNRELNHFCIYCDFSSYEIKLIKKHCKDRHNITNFSRFDYYHPNYE